MANSNNHESLMQHQVIWFATRDMWPPSWNQGNGSHQHCNEGRSWVVNDEHRHHFQPSRGTPVVTQKIIELFHRTTQFVVAVTDIGHASIGLPPVFSETTETLVQRHSPQQFRFQVGQQLGRWLFHRGHWSLVTLFTVSTFWSKKDRVTSDQVCLESHTCHTNMVRPLCGRLWPYSCPKYHFWRKSRRKVSFLSFAASFLKDFSQKSFVLELRSFIFEGSFAEKLGFWVWKLQFWMKSRRKASF